MVKRGYVLISFLLLVFITSLTITSASSVDSEIKKITNYAKEYETGNLNYVQFLIYSSAVREKMNEILGASGRDMGGILKEEQLRTVLGEPTEDTNWVWVENEEKEKKMGRDVPVWRKTIFDGKKIQIRLNAWPFIFSKRNFNEDDDEDGKNKELDDLEGKLVYRLNFETEFKKPEEQLDIQGKIGDIKTLAEIFNLDPSSGNAESLAKESVNAERTFESYFKQSGEKCEEVMGDIFGTENKRQTQQLLVQEISFCEGDNYDVIARLEMCDDCEWRFINLNFDVRGRGPGFKPQELDMNQVSSEGFKNMDSATFEREVKRIIDGMKQSCDSKDVSSIMRAQSSLWPLNEAWNQKSNDVWQEVEKTFESQMVSRTPEQQQEFDQNYGWLKQEQEKRKKVKELGAENYEKRKNFYSDLFSGYEKKEFYFTQIEFEKRLVEEFKEMGEEVCNNNKDDNQNEAIDCADNQCGGKICGKGTTSVQEGNGTATKEVDFYCIEKECKAREEIVETFLNASMICSELPFIECSQGNKAFFSRYDNVTNCPVETKCLEEVVSCNISAECSQPACGIAECIENRCEVIGLAECRELECVEGDKKICEQDGEIVEICNNGFWEKTGECAQEAEIMNETILSNECLSASDCGDGSICSNGVCELIPNVVIVEPPEEEPTEENEGGQEQVPETQNEQGETFEGTPEIEQSPDDEQTQEQNEQEETSSEPEQESESGSESQESESTISGNVIFRLMTAFFTKIKYSGNIIVGFEVEGEGAPTEESAPEPQDNQQPQESQSPENQPPQDGQQPPMEDGRDGERRIDEDRRENNDDRDQGREYDNEDREREDEMREQENKERCENDCKRPCVEKCIREECGEELDCVVEEAQRKCEGTCEAEDSCVEKCTKGGDWWQEFENKDENKQEKGVFQAGGSCRTSRGKTEGFIWFGGWGDPFERIQPLKNKYYSGGQGDWCKYDFENLKKQREEFEKGFNQEFVKWFFEKYLTNSAAEWEQSVSGIFELYWKDVDNSREMAYRMQCLGIDELPNVNLVNVKYESEYGSIEFWEEIKTVKLEGMDKEVQVVSPYMKAWVFPTKEFIKYEMKKAMENHEFPGSPEDKMERKNEEGPTAEEREMIKRDSKFMEMIKEASGAYGGNLDAVVRFVDNESVVFNLYAQINENDIIKVEPMLPEEVPAEDVRIDIEFQSLYDLIYMQEKEMSGQRMENPPWDRKIQPIQGIKNVVNNVKMYFKVRSMLNSAKISPEASEKEVRALMKSFFSMMMESDKGDKQGDGMKENGEDMGEEKGVWEEKGKITGEVIFI